VSISIEPQPVPGNDNNDSDHSDGSDGSDGSNGSVGKLVRHIIRWQGSWFTVAPRIEVRLPGQGVIHPIPSENSVTCEYQL
jgi:hypothetical protein